jgi:hypothetical protein
MGLLDGRVAAVAASQMDVRDAAAKAGDRPVTEITWIM